MTQEEKEVVRWLKLELEQWEHDCFSDHPVKDALKIAIKAIEEKPIIDKIYTDIQSLRGCSCGCSDGIIDDVEDILDKYRN